MKFPLVGRFFKAAPVRRASDTPLAPTTIRIGNNAPIRIIQYDNALAANKALGNPVTFRCLNKIATSVQTVSWYAEADPDVVANERAGATVIKELNALLAKPNDNMAADQLRYWLALTYACFGRSPFKVGFGVQNRPNGIYPLDPDFVRAKSNDRGSIIAYEYGNVQAAQTFPSQSRAGVGQAFVAEIATPSISGLMDTGKNINALGAIGLPTAIVEMLLQRAYDTASGHPNMKYIITAEKTLTERQKDDIKDHLENAQPDGEDSGEVLFLTNTKIEVHKLDNDLGNIHSKIPLDDMSRMIAGAFGIPISLLGLGAADGAKFAGNYIESRQSFWEDTIIPWYLTPIATGLTAALCPYGARIRFDLDSIDAVQDSRAGRAQKLEKVTFLTNDEKREIAGFAPLTPEQKAALATEAANRTPSGAGSNAPDNTSTQ